MRLIDVTVPLRVGMPAYPGEAAPRFHLLKSLARGDIADVSGVEMALHSGTHVDAPNHFLIGAAGVDALPLDVLVGPCRVVDVDADPHVGAADLASALGEERPERILLRTRNSRSRPACWERPAFTPDFAALAVDGARWLVARGTRLVGIDYLSVEPFGVAEPATHLVLLAAGVVIVEGLDLRAVDAGSYELLCLPLPMASRDGAPARVVLRAR
ncbi:MAG: cyclase family protein [Chloroflexi bacterium]|nr:cyclase family protein [Chloroflexota bacterium]